MVNNRIEDLRTRLDETLEGVHHAENDKVGMGEPGAEGVWVRSLPLPHDAPSFSLTTLPPSPSRRSLPAVFPGSRKRISNRRARVLARTRKRHLGDTGKTRKGGLARLEMDACSRPGTPTRSLSGWGRCAVAPPGNASRKWTVSHIQAHQLPPPPFGARCDWPAWKCVSYMDGLSHPGTPTLWRGQVSEGEDSARVAMQRRNAAAQVRISGPYLAPIHPLSSPLSNPYLTPI